MRTSRLTLLVFTVFLAACDDGSSSAPAVSGLPAQVPVIAYVPSLATHQVSLIDTQLNRVVARVPMGFNPVVLAITPDGRKLFSANFETDYLTVLDTRTLETRRITLGAFPFAALMARDGRELYIPAGGYQLDYSRLIVIDVARETVAREFVFSPLRTFPFGVELSPDGRTVYVSFTNNTVAAFDAQTGAGVRPPISSGGLMPAWTSISPDGRLLYALNFFSGNTAVFDTGRWTQVGNIDGGPFSYPIVSATSPDGRKHYIAGASGLLVADTESFRLIGRIPTHGTATSVGFMPDGQGYVTETGEDLLPPDIPNPLHFFALAGLGALVGTHPGIVRRFDPATDAYSAPPIETDPIPGVIAFGSAQP
jgi:hypothetical protein